MEKYITKHGVKIIWDDDKIKDMFYVTNVVYRITLPNRQMYYGSAELLADRIINHCTHINLKTAQERLFNAALKKYMTIKVSVVGEYKTIYEAREAEKKFINKISKKIYQKLGNVGDFKEVVNTVILNSDLYVNCN